MIDFEMKLRMKRRFTDRAGDGGTPVLPGALLRRLLLLSGFVAVLTFAYVVLGVTPDVLLGSAL